MRRRRSFPITAAATALVVILAACSGASDSSSPLGPSSSPTVRSSQTAPPASFVPPNGEPYDTVFYDNPGVNPFIDTEDDPFSTFALDVDTGSYAIARRYLTDGFLPDKDSVRVEEFVNYFDQNYPTPDSGEDLSVTVDGGSTPFVQNERNRVVRIGVQAGEVDPAERADANLVFVIDTSGSMDRENRLELVKDSLELLVASLRSTDTIGIVEYGTRARLVLDPTPVGDEERILRAVDSLHPGGSTNAAAGLEMAYGLVGEEFREGGINRVILCSDGVANVGAATDASGILDLIRDASERHVDLVTVGFGMGNYNDVLMEQLADEGDGFYAYVDTLAEARRLFVEDLSGTLQTVARDAKIQVEFDPGTVQSWRLIGFENRALADEDFRDDSVDAGEIGAGHTVTALYEIKPILDSNGRIGVTTLRWRDSVSNEVRELAQPITLNELASTFELSNPRFQLDVVVAQYAEVLRESIWAQQTGTRLSDLAAWGDHLVRVLPEDEDVRELAGLMRQASAISSR